ncbi:MAG TPA: hypothetical protein VMF31_14400 [Solirubrobacterales bacterium]|nr:hypothetical protein [Solirubrobacterales bacterium]
MSLASERAEAAPQGPWALPATSLSEVGLDSSEPQITASPDGTTTAIWRRSGNNWIIQAATRPPAGGFGVPIDLSVDGQNASSPQITTSPDGTATAIWTRRNGNNWIIQTATRPPGGDFGAPIDLSAAGQNASAPQITTSPDGTTTAIWSRYDGNDLIIQTATRPPGGAFEAPISLSAGGQDAAVPQITAGPDNTTTAIWRRNNGNDWIVQAAIRPPGGAFGAPFDLSAAGQDATAPQITAGPDNTTTAVWSRNNGNDWIVQAATRPPDGAFEAPIDLSAAGQNASIPQITTSPDGGTTAIWRHTDGNDWTIQASTRPPGGDFGAPFNLSTAGQNAIDPQITTSPDGTTTAIWSRNNGDDHIIQAATRPPGSAFEAPIDLSAAGQNASVPQITAGPDGTTTAVWSRTDGNNLITQAASTSLPEHKLTVIKQGDGAGRVSSAPVGIDCGALCEATFTSHTMVTLTATPEAGSSFSGWGGACQTSGKQPSCLLTIEEAAQATAGFARKPFHEKPLPGKKNPTDTTALFDGKRLHIRLKCPVRFKPKCLSTTTPVTLKTKKGKPMAVKPTRKRIVSDRWKRTTFLIRPGFRAKVAAMTFTDEKLLVVKQKIRSRRIRAERNTKTSTVFHVYKVRVKL